MKRLKDIIEHVRSIKPLVLLLLLLKVSLPLYLIINHGRLGLTLDSVAYLSGANYIKQGLWFKNISYTGVPDIMAHYPPIISIILAAFPINPWYTFFFLNLACYIASTILLFVIIFKATKAKYIASFFTLIWAIAVQTLTVYSQSWSEPLFITLTLVLFLLWIKYNEAKQWKYIFTITIITAIMPLVRYAGLFLIPLNLVLFIFLLPKDGLKKWLKIIGLTLLQAMPYLIWSKYLSLINGSIRTFDFYIMTSRKFAMLFSTIQMFFLPRTDIPILKTIVAILIFAIFLIGTFLLALKRKRTDNIDFIGRYSSFFIAIYIVFLIFSMTFFDKTTPFDYRILSIIMPYIFINLSIYFYKYENKILWLLLFSYITIALYLAYPSYRLLHYTYYPFASTQYDNLEIIKMQKEDKSIGIISDIWEGLYARTGCDCAKYAKLNNLGDSYWTHLDEYIKNHKSTYLTKTSMAPKNSQWAKLQVYKDRYELTEVFQSPTEKIYLVTLR